MGRGLSYRREVRNKAIARKKRICSNYGFTWYNVDGKYAKGKIHCNCDTCAYGKNYDLPTYKMLVEHERFQFALRDLAS